MNPQPIRLVVTTTIPATAFDFMRGQLCWLSAQGFEVHLVSSPGALLDQAGRREGVATHAIPMRRELAPVADLVSLGRWLRLLRRLRPDVVAYGTPKAGLLAGLAAMATGTRRRVYLLRGLRFAGASGARRTLLRAVEQLTCATAHVVVAVGPSLADAAVRAGVVPAGRVVVIGDGSSNGVDPELFQPPTDAQRTDARVMAGLPAATGGGPVIGFVGRLAADKGLECLDAAYQLLAEQVPGVRLLLIGGTEPDATAVRARLVQEQSAALARKGRADMVRSPAGTRPRRPASRWRTRTPRGGAAVRTDRSRPVSGLASRRSRTAPLTSSSHGRGHSGGVT